MKKLLILILIALLSVLSIYVVLKGVSIGSLEILGIKGIRDENAKLDQTIQQAGKLAEKDYVQALAEIDTDAKKLKQEKERYEDMTAISEETDIASANQLETYEYDSLMVKLGNHATSKGAIPKIDITSGGATGIYNLNITATGRYIAITDFISSIENDSTLGFKIEDFKMGATQDGNDLQATFKCNGISIKGISSTAPITTTTQGKDEESTTDTTNTTDATNGTRTTNTSSTNNTAR